MFPIQANILHRVFFIKAGKYGTAFTIDVEGAEYLVTAKHLFDQAAEKFPTAAYAVLDLSIDRWADLAPDCATLSHFIRPRDLDPALGPERR